MDVNAGLKRGKTRTQKERRVIIKKLIVKKTPNFYWAFAILYLGGCKIQILKYIQ